MKNLILFIILLLYQLNIYSQEFGEITGKVIDQNSGKPLNHIDISISKSSFITQSDKNGEFILKNIPMGTYQLEFDGFPFKRKYLENITIEAEKSTRIITTLTIDTAKTHGVLDSSTVYFAFISSNNKKITKDDISIEYKDNDFSYSINGKDFFVDKYFAQQHTDKYETSKKDTFYISFRITKMGETIAKGNLSLLLKNDWSWQIDFHIADKNPIYGCFGCQGYKSFPIDLDYKSSPSDSLYVIWGGNYITFPVIY